jgi:glycosyltransferase involved in cell wall biosynthesis
MVGRLTDLKGGNVLLDALPLAGKILGGLLSLTLVGDGPERRHLEARARAEGVSVRFSGWTSAEVRDQILRTADLLVVPSLWPEPWGLVGLEAARVGVPAVAFAVGGIPEWLDAGQSGELAPADPPTAEGLASAIARALQDPLHYARIRRGAWEQGRRFTIDRHVNELLAVLSAAAV